MRTNKYGIVGKAFRLECKKACEEYAATLWSNKHHIDISGILKSLPHCHCDECMIYEALPPMPSQHVDHCIPYARYPGVEPLTRSSNANLKSKRDLPLFYFTLDNSLFVDDSLDGAWESFLLSQMEQYLPTIRHQWENQDDYILDLDDYFESTRLDRLCCEFGWKDIQYLLPESNLESSNKHCGYQEVGDAIIAATLINNPISLPHIQCDYEHYWGNSCYKIYCTFFNANMGLYRRLIRAERKEDSFAFTVVDDELLARYR